MRGEDRRIEILNQIKNSDKPLSGTVLAGIFQVSRQVIVQDIALLRAADYDIISTNRGYILKGPNQSSRVFCVRHTDDQIEEELNTIVDCGGIVKDVFVNHEVYGEIRADLNVSSRLQVSRFMEGIRSGKSSPLNKVTSGVHCHTVLAESKEVLDSIEQALGEHGFEVQRIE